MRWLGTHHVLEVVDDCALVVGRAGPRPEVVQQIEQEIRSARAPRRRLGYFQIILPERGDGVIGADTRRAFAEMIERSGHLVDAAAVVILRRGFAGAAVRSVASGLLLARRLPFPARVFSSTSDGVRWMRARLVEGGGGSLDSTAMLDAIAVLEAELARSG